MPQLRLYRAYASLSNEEAYLLHTPDTTGFDMCYLENEGLYLMFDTNSTDSLNDDDAVGSLHLSVNETSVCIYDVSIEKSRQNKGLGTIMLLSFIKEYFQTSDLPLILNVRSTNIPATSLYKKCGFTEVSHIDYYYI